MTYVSTVLAASPVGFWELGEALFASAAADQAGNKNGVYTNSTGITLGQTGIPGGGGATACKFTAANSGYVAIADAAAQHVGNTGTWEAWIKRSSLAATSVVFTAQSNSFLIYFSSDNKLNFAGQTLGGICTSTSTVADTTTFHHIVATKATSVSAHIYIDGVDVTSAVTDRTLVNSNAFTLSATSSSFDGTMAMMAIYPTSITQATVTLHYRLGANLSPLNSVAPAASGSTTVGSVVSVTNGTWTDAGSPTFTYQWKRNGTPIGGATSSTYTLVAADDATTILCTVTDTDVVGATSANSNALTDTTPIPAAVTVDDLASIYAAHISQV